MNVIIQKGPGRQCRGSPLTLLPRARCAASVAHPWQQMRCPEG